MDLTLAAQIKTPEGPQAAVVQFNKLTGVMVGILFNVDPDTLNQEFFDYRVVNDFDYSSQVVVGTIHDFKVVDKDTLPGSIYEADLDLTAQQKITKVYPVVNQINILSRALDKIATIMGIDPEELAEMHEMNAYIDEIKADNRRYKEFYAASPDYDYKDYASVAQDEANRLEGGVHEAYGPRTVAGGSVF